MRRIAHSRSFTQENRAVAKRYHDDMVMKEIMRRWPGTVRIALKHRLLCVGCPIAAFHTIEDAIREHGIDGEAFRRDILKEIDRDGG
mgnify:CR=1 FL=1